MTSGEVRIVNTLERKTVLERNPCTRVSRLYIYALIRPEFNKEATHKTATLFFRGAEAFGNNLNAAETETDQKKAGRRKGHGPADWILSLRISSIRFLYPMIHWKNKNQKNQKKGTKCTNLQGGARLAWLGSLTEAEIPILVENTLYLKSQVMKFRKKNF